MRPVKKQTMFLKNKFTSHAKSSYFQKDSFNRIPSKYWAP